MISLYDVYLWTIVLKTIFLRLIDFRLCARIEMRPLNRLDSRKYATAVVIIKHRFKLLAVRLLIERRFWGNPLSEYIVRFVNYNLAILLLKSRLT